MTQTWCRGENSTWSMRVARAPGHGQRSGPTQEVVLSRLPSSRLHAAARARAGKALPGKKFETVAADCGLELEPFQRKIAKAVQGPERECIVLVPRDNGKS